MNILDIELEQIQDELTKQGVVDIKFCWNEQAIREADSIDDVKRDVIKMLRAHLNEDGLSTFTKIGD